MSTSARTIDHAAWLAEGERRFGPDRMNWTFVCPSCGHVARAGDWHTAGAPEGAVAFSCVGRWVGDRRAAGERAFRGAGGPCNYAGGGLFGLNPVTVVTEDGKTHPTFEFADAVVTAAAVMRAAA